MKALKFIGLFLLFFSSIKILSRLKAANLLNFEIKGAKLKGNLLNLNIDLSTEVENNTNTDVTMNWLKGKVYLDDTEIGEVLFYDSIILAPGITIIEIPIYLQPLHTITQIINNLKNINAVLRFKGKVDFNRIAIPIDENFPLL
jgi:hypothetical protein